MSIKFAFISHAYVDTAKCAPYIEALHRHGISVTQNHINSLYSIEGNVALEQELRSSGALIVMVTSTTIDSARVKTAIHVFSGVMAKDPTRLLILVMLEPCEPPPVPKLAKPLVVDATTQPLDQVVDELIKALEIRDSLANSLSDVVYSPTASPPVGVPRRTLVVAGVAGVAVLGTGVFWWLRTASRPDLPSTPSSRMSLTPRATPIPLAPFIYHGHSKQVWSVAWSPNGSRIASASFDKTAQVWDAANGGHPFIYRGHSDGLWSVAWSPDGKRIASGSSDWTVQVWGAPDGKHPFIYSGHSHNVLSVAWSPDGKRIASASDDGTVQVWDATDGGHPFIYLGHDQSGDGSVNSAAWSPDGKRIASAGYKTVQVWDATDGGHPFIYRGHSDTIYSVAWSPDGKRIASASADTTVQVWDAADGGRVSTYMYVYNGEYTFFNGKPVLVTSVAWSPNGKRIAGASIDAHVWDAADGSHTFVYRGHSNPLDPESDEVNCVAWSPSGLNIASGGYDNTVQVWQPQ